MIKINTTYKETLRKIDFKP